MKRFLIVSMSIALAAIAVIGLTWGSTSVSAAPQRWGGSTGTHAGTRAGGNVASVSGSTITVTGRNGKSRAILTTASTTVTLDGKASSLSAIAAGQFLFATGTTDSAGAFTATAIHARTSQPHWGANPGTRAGGNVASVSGSTITVTGRNGKSRAILTTASTTVTLDGKASSLSAIATGQFLFATGTTDSAGAFTATAIHARTSQPHAHTGHGRPRP